MTVIKATITLFFDIQADAIAFRDAVQPHFAKVRNLINGEKSNVVVHICHHDEVPPWPCSEIIYSWEKI